jgi:hypothetical protein
LTLIPAAALSDTTGYKALGDFSYSAGAATVAIPQATTPGLYVIQWAQDSPGNNLTFEFCDTMPGPYYNCIDYNVTAYVAPAGTSTGKTGSATAVQASIALILVALIAALMF